MDQVSHLFLVLKCLKAELLHRLEGAIVEQCVSVVS